MENVKFKFIKVGPSAELESSINQFTKGRFIMNIDVQIEHNRSWHYSVYITYCDQ